MRLHPTLFLFLSVLLSSNVIFSQQAILQGVITDAGTDEALIGVSVRVGATGAATDGNGQYRFELAAGNYEVEFIYTGYESRKQPVRLVAGQTLTLNMKLGDANNLLQQATVTAGKFEKP